MPQNLGGFLRTIPGTISRGVDDVVISMRNADTDDIKPGDAVFLKNDSNGAGVTRVKEDSTFAGFVGIAVRAASKTNETYGSNDPAVWKSGEPVDVLVRGCITVPIDYLACTAGGAVHLNLADGKYKTAAVSGSTIQLENCAWRTSTGSSGNRAELVIKTRNVI